MILTKTKDFNQFSQIINNSNLEALMKIKRKIS